MKFLALALAAITSCSCFAQDFKGFLLLNTGNNFSEIGTVGSADIKTEADMTGEGFGVGFEYKLPVNHDAFNLSVGLMYELEREIEQITQVTSGAASTSRNNLPELQMTSLYVNVYAPVAEKISIVGGVAYFIPEVTGRGDFKNYDIDSGLGYQFGLDFRVTNNFFVQALHRRIILGTEDTDYSGEVNLSNLSLLAGYVF